VSVLVSVGATCTKPHKNLHRAPRTRSTRALLIPTKSSSVLGWCARGDLNSHGLPHWILSSITPLAVFLPIEPHQCISGA
jgi:hypothetical protein